MCIFTYGFLMNMISKQSEYLQEVCRGLNITPSALAKKIGVSHTSLTRLAKEEGNELKHSFIHKMEQLSGIPFHQSGERAIPVLGEVPGGDLREAIQIDDGEHVYFATNRPNVIALKVRGESINRVAPDGSYVILDTDQRDPETLAGELVVVCFKRQNAWEATCKLFKRNPDRFEPHSREHHDTIFPDTEWEICGRVIGAVSFVGDQAKLINSNQQGAAA